MNILGLKALLSQSNWSRWGWTCIRPWPLWSSMFSPDAAQVLKQPERVITINEQHFHIQLKKFEDMEVREGPDPNIPFTCFSFTRLHRIALYTQPTVRSQVVSKVRKRKCSRAYWVWTEANLALQMYWRLCSRAETSPLLWNISPMTALYARSKYP